MCSQEAFFYRKSGISNILEQEQIYMLAQGQTPEKVAKMEIPWPQNKGLETKEHSDVCATARWTERWYGHYSLLKPLQKKES